MCKVSGHLLKRHNDDDDFDSLVNGVRRHIMLDNPSLGGGGGGV